MAVWYSAIRLVRHVQRIGRQEAFKFETDQPHIYRNEGRARASCFCFFLDYK